MILCFLKLNCYTSVMWDFSDKDIYSLYMSPSYIRDHRNIQDGSLCDFSQQLKAVNQCQKKLQLRCRVLDWQHKSNLKISFFQEVYVKVWSSYILIANQAPPSQKCSNRSFQ